MPTSRRPAGGEGHPTVTPTVEFVSAQYADVPARAIERVNPIYPEKALAARVRGVVVLRAVISEAGGAPLSVTPIEKARPDLAEAAVEAVKQWRFEPAIKNGRAVRSAAIIRIPFEAVPFARTPFPELSPTPRPAKTPGHIKRAPTPRPKQKSGAHSKTKKKPTPTPRPKKKQ